MNASSSCSRSWNPRRTWKLLGGLAVILMAGGCAAPDFTPINDPKVRVEADGFSVLPPSGSGCYRTPDLHLKGTDGVAFAKQASTGTHTIAISVARHKGFNPAVAGFPNYATNPAQFAAYVQASTRQMNPARGIKAKPSSGTSTRSPADGKMKIKMTMFKRSGIDNATERVGKTVVGLMTAGMIVPFKDASGAVVIEATLYDMRDPHVLRANTSSDSSFRPVGEADFDLQKLVAKLFEEFI